MPRQQYKLSTQGPVQNILHRFDVTAFCAETLSNVRNDGVDRPRDNFKIFSRINIITWRCSTLPVHTHKYVHMQILIFIRMIVEFESDLCVWCHDLLLLPKAIDRHRHLHECVRVSSSKKFLFFLFCVCGRETVGSDSFAYRIDWMANRNNVNPKRITSISRRVRFSHSIQLIWGNSQVGMCHGGSPV